MDGAEQEVNLMNLPGEYNLKNSPSAAEVPGEASNKKPLRNLCGDGLSDRGAPEYRNSAPRPVMGADRKEYTQSGTCGRYSLSAPPQKRIPL